jgi:hypothetical protein
MKPGSVIAAILLIVGCAAAGERTADTTDGTSALPQLFERVVDFNLPVFHGAGAASRGRLAGSVVALALWADAPAAARPMAEFDSLIGRYGDLERVQFVVMSKFDVARDDDELLPRALEHSDLVAVAPAMLAMFGRPQLDAVPEIDFKLPSFLLLDERGRVIRRVQGLPYAVFSSVLDSIERMEKSAPALRDSALADSLRGPLARAFERLDLNAMYDPLGEVRYDPCRAVEKPRQGLVPAMVQLVGVTASGRTVTAKLEVVSVAHLTVDSTDRSSACHAKRLLVEPKTSTDTFDVTLRGAGGWWTLERLTPEALLIPRSASRYDLDFRFGGLYTLKTMTDSIRSARSKPQ